MKGSNYKGNRRTVGARRRKSCCPPNQNAIHPPGWGARNMYLMLSSWKEGLLLLLLLVKQSWVLGSQRPALLVFLRLRGWMPDTSSGSQEPAADAVPIKDRKRNNNFFFYHLQISNWCLHWQNNLWKHSVARKWMVGDLGC